MIWAALFAAALVASTLGGLLGFGTAALLLPILSLALGTEVAVPTLGIAMVFANASRAAFSWQHVNWKVVAAFSATSVPFSLLGAFIYVRSPVRWINLAIATFLILSVPVRRLASRKRIDMKLPLFAPLGAAIGTVSGIGGVVGPAATPFMLSFGLVGASYLGTNGVNSTLVHAAKSFVYWTGGSMRPVDAMTGCGLGLTMLLGSFLGRRQVDRIQPEHYIRIIDACVIALGGLMLVQSCWPRGTR